VPYLFLLDAAQKQLVAGIRRRTVSKRDWTSDVCSPDLGTYLIEVTSRSAGETGPYELTLGSPTSPYAVGGRVTAADGVTGLGGVTVTFARGRGDVSTPVTVRTRTPGSASKNGFEPGTEYRVTLSPEYAFSPGS